MIQYPKGTIRPSQTPRPTKRMERTNHSGRGMFLENLLNQTNQVYLQKQLAVIHKKPTPIQIVNVDYPKRSATVIKEAYFRQPSTTDYNGVYNGAYIDFEAKETKNKTSFPLANIHQHQLEHMDNCVKQGGIVFFIIYFSSLQEYFLVEASYIIDYIKNNGDKSSIPLSYIKDNGYPIFLSIQGNLDYLPIVDELLLK
ncbi:recombination protein U [Granulicatella balaenopterae]|uniref:Holliday junction resolvase RecU n=1 Tax=Granulicatella balaenopterae TaxID=137733 RepID=A0A1H9MTU7_9LACT|nr:Holliday junction resolvase RecU [Granulicatella balaenopterae]SER27130.1 recombination protein U [Granulicatella balaenopterae]